MQLPMELLLHIFHYQNKFFFCSKKKVFINILPLQSVLAKQFYQMVYQQSSLIVLLPINKNKCYEIKYIYMNSTWVNVNVILFKIIAPNTSEAEINTCVNIWYCNHNNWLSWKNNISKFYILPKINNALLFARKKRNGYQYTDN